MKAPYNAFRTLREVWQKRKVQAIQGSVVKPVASVEQMMRRATERHRAGDVAGASTLYRRVLAKAPDLADAHHLLGLTLHQRGDHTQAQREIGRAIALNPHAAPYHGNLGLVRMAAGESDAAMASFNQALALDPDYHPARLNLAAALAAADRHDEALSALRYLLDRTGPSPDLHARMAECLYRTGRFEEAVEHYRAALQARPDGAGLHAALAETLQRIGEEEAALASYDTALRLQPDLTAAQLNRATLLRDLGRPREALDAYETVRRSAPDLLDAVAGQINTYERMGEFERAWQTLVPVLARHALHPLIAVARAGLAGRYEAPEAALPALDTLSAQDALPDPQRQQVLFARARLLERVGRFEEALEAFRQANALTRSAFDHAQHAQRCAAIRAGFDSHAFDDPGGSDSERPVFIVGMPRSGTSLVEQILASHPEVHGAGELTVLPRLTVTAPLAPAYPQSMRTLSADVLRQAAHIYLGQIERMDAQAGRLTDKMPSNFLHLGLIRRLFPHARIIHIQRDAMDTCVSCFCQNFGERLPYATNFADLAQFYGEYLRMMAHWRAVLPGPYLELRYEDLIADTEAWSRRLVDFVGLDWHPGCLEFHRSRRYVRTASYQQVRQPIYGHAVGRWKRYGPALEPLRDALTAVGASGAWTMPKSKSHA